MPFGTPTAAPAVIANCRSYPGNVEIEIRAGFCDQDGELLAVLERPGWRRVTARRRDEIAGEMLRVCETTDVGIAEAWQRRADQLRFVVGYLHPSFRPGERAMTTPGSPPTIATADLLIGLLERVSMSEAQIARATQAEPETIQAWLRRREAPAGLEAQRLIALVVFAEEMAHNIRAAALVEWLERDVDSLQGANPRRARRRRLRAADPTRARTYARRLHIGTARFFVAGAILRRGSQLRESPQLRLLLQ